MTWLLDNGWTVAGAVLAVTTTLSGIAHVVIKKLAERAATTPGSDDDERYARWLAKLDTVMFVLEIVRRMPRLAVGPFPSTQPIASATSGQTMPPMKSLSAPPLPSDPWADDHDTVKDVHSGPPVKP